MTRELLKGNEAIAEAAVRAGLDAYFGYPITPQTELLEYLARRLPELGRVFIQAESEVAAINMVYGAAAAGKRVLTSSSGLGISLMQEGFSYILASDVPAVIVDVMRAGPGLGNIAPSQADYNQVVKAAGSGGARPIVLAPATVQEAIDLTVEAFDLAERYRTIVLLVLDGLVGQLMEPAELPPMRVPVATPPAWALSGAQGRPKNVIKSVEMLPEQLEPRNRRMEEKHAAIARSEVRFREVLTEDAELLVVGFGSAGRIAQSAVRAAREQGIKAGLFRPVSLWPFPSERLAALAQRSRGLLVVELNAGQMIDDVRLAVGGQVPVHFYGRMGGMVPLPDEVLDAIAALETATALTPGGVR